jgi:hypothetical protein
MSLKKKDLRDAIVAARNTPGTVFKVYTFPKATKWEIRHNGDPVKNPVNYTFVNVSGTGAWEMSRPTTAGRTMKHGTSALSCQHGMGL